MKKELSAKEYVRHMDGLLFSTRIVAGNLAFNAAGLAAGEEGLHREKLLKSIVALKLEVDGLLGKLADEEEIERAKRALAKDSIAAILESIRKKGGK